MKLIHYSFANIITKEVCSMIHVIILYEGTPKGKSTFVTKTYHFAIEALNILPNFKDSVCPFGSAWVVTKDTSITFGIHQLEFPKNTRLLTESKENIEPAKESPENKISEYYTLSSEHLNNLKKIARLTIGVPQNDRQLLINAISGFFNTSANKKLQSIHSKISPENYVATYLTTTKNILRNINNHKSKISDNAQHIVNFFNFFKHNKATKSILDIDHVEKINKMSVLTTLLSKASEIIFNENKLYEKLSEHSTYYKKVYEKLFNPGEQESDDKILSETNDNIDYFPSRNTIKCIREMKNNFPNTIAAIKSITQITTTAYSLAEFATSLILKQGIENLKIAVHTNPAKFDGNSRSIISILCLTLLNKTVEMTDQLQALFMKDLLTE